MITSRQLRRPALVFAAVYTLAAGGVHVREWLDGYRHIPSSVMGSFVVRVGFPVDAALALLSAAALLFVATRAPRFALPVIVGSLALQAGSLAVLIATRVSSVFGWAEPVWNRGANEARAAAIGALLMLTLSLVTIATARPTLRPATVA